jgi:4-amino-4-deoxy-L-arabinose transferase-like glycosyltransferase
LRSNPALAWLRAPAAPRIAVHALLLVRAVMAALVPLTADEAYYWLWSKHLDVGYLDHPPAIAWLIRLGTAIFGDTPFGVRVAGILLSGLATMFVWESARILLKSEARAFTAALLFNLTLMVSIEMLAATPDMPSLVTSAGLLFCLVRLQDSGQARWWLWAGLAAGLSLLSKYSALFEIAGVFLWLALAPQQRKWFATPWPWAAAILALLVFAPNLVWQTSHDWETFVFQGNRVVGHHLTTRFLFEFLGAQLGLASPFLFVLGLAGLARARPQKNSENILFLPAMLAWPGILYFLIHALHDRVQGNWPCFLYPAFVILAVSEFSRAGWRRWCAAAAAPVAALLLLVVYGQALTGFLPMGARDPLARLLGVGFRPVADSLAGAVRAQGIGAVLTTDYESTAWLRFYEPGLTVVQIGEVYRYPTSPMPDAALMRRPLLYFVEHKRDQSAELRKHFSSVSLATQLRIGKAGRELALYEIYAVETPKAPVPGRIP